MKELEKVVSGDIKQLDTKPPEDSKVKSSFAIEAEVENKPQELKSVRPFYTMTKSVPTSLPAEAQIVMQSLFACFDRQKSVQEGKLADLVWGFEQGGIPGPCTVMGLKHLEKAGYVKFRAPDNTHVEMTKDNIAHLWVEYTSKLLEMVYEGSTSI